MSGILDGLIDCSDAILGIRDDIGAKVSDVYLVTRTWSGARVGAGECQDTEVQISPTPWVVDLSNDHRVKEGGAVQNGDIELRQISKKNYPLKTDIDATTTGSVEKFYKISGVLYQVVKVSEKYITWSVQLRRRSDQRKAEEYNET
jgi:hypothetical protein